MRLFISSWRHAILGSEITCEGVGAGKSAGHTNLLNVQFGLLVHKAYGIVKAKLADVGWERGTIAALREGGTDALLREASAVDKRLAAEIGLQEKLLLLNQIAQAKEQLLVGKSCEI